MIASYGPELSGPLVADVDVGGTETPVIVVEGIARERAASPLVEAALGDATIELLGPTEAPGATGAAATARHRIGLPEREGVDER